ncbi:hypothetical protein [Pseudoduganella sp. HUAS MS19]
MESKFNLQGRIEIDDALITENLSLSFYDDQQTIELSDANQIAPLAGGLTLFIHPLSRHMLRSGLSFGADRCFEYSISGTNVGTCQNGPLGHPADGEYDTWPIKQFRTRSIFSRERRGDP